MQYGLMKSEPRECSADDALAAQHATIAWVGVRNYQGQIYAGCDAGIEKRQSPVDHTCAGGGLASDNSNARN